MAWMSAVLVVAACGHSTPSSTSTTTHGPLDVVVYSAVEFKLKYRPLFEPICTTPSCYVTNYEPVFERLPLDYGALPAAAQANALARIKTFLKGADALTQQGCGDPAKDSSPECRAAATGPAASVDYLRSYVNS
jgi:hypothetical protein